MDGILKFNSFEERDRALDAVLQVAPEVAARLLSSASLPTLVARNLTEQDRVRVVSITGGAWAGDVRFQPMGQSPVD